MQTIPPRARLALALAFLTRLPVPGAWFPPQPVALSAAMVMFPLVGALVGGLAGAALVAAHGLGLSAGVAAWIAIVTAVAVTGALHQDGLADLADALGARVPPAEAPGNGVLSQPRALRQRRLAIMADSRVGPFGVIALILVLTLQAAVLSALSPGTALAALVASGALSRAVMVAIAAGLPRARRHGLGFSAGRPSRRIAVATAVIAGALSLASLARLSAIPVILLWVTAAMVTLVLGHTLRHLLGGWTGDTLGAAQQLSETALLVALMAAL